MDRKRSRWQLSVYDGAALKRHRQGSKNPYRVSPIYPAIPRLGTVPATEQFFVGFFIFERPYSAIASLLKTHPSSEHGHLWFSHGLCAVVVFAENRNTFEHIESTTQSFGLRGIESWRINKGEVKDVKWRLSEPAEWDTADFDFSYDGFGADITSTLDELSHSLTAAVRLAAQFMPSELVALKRLVKAVREILSELVFLCKLTDVRPKHFSDEAVAALGTDSVKRQKMINQRMGHIVQISSSLSYAVSQAFSGTIPLVQSDCHLKTFSLLGIGSAHHALSNFSRFAELTFEANPVDEVISSKFHTLEAGLRVPTNPSQHTADEMKEWDNPRWDVDTYIDKVEKREKKLNLVYYSGRLGFREAEFSVTAAQQVLLNGCTAEWSLMTFTHEMMHAHVRGLISSIFADASNQFRFETLKEILDRFYDYLESPPDTRLPKQFSDSLRFLILSYAGYRKQIQAFAQAQPSGGDKNEGIDLEFPEARKLVEALSDANREINEIFVHILDFNYFYNCRTKAYLGLLWRSWVPVPVVLEDVQQYVWRSLITLASQQTGDANARFSASRGILEETLRELRASSRNELVLIEKALDHLGDETQRSDILIRFQAALPIVDMVQKFLCASHIHSALYDDDNGEQVGEEYFYNLETGEFKEVKLVSPIALAADRLRRSLKNETPAFNNGHAAAWFFLVCGECSRPERPQ